MIVTVCPSDVPDAATEPLVTPIDIREGERCCGCSVWRPCECEYCACGSGKTPIVPLALK